MAQTDLDGRMSLSLLAKNRADKKGQSLLWTLPCLWPRVGAQVALQRCPTLRTSALSLPQLVILPRQRGHLYFAE
jgi:hypothetical protein